MRQSPSVCRPVFPTTLALALAVALATLNAPRAQDATQSPSDETEIVLEAPSFDDWRHASTLNEAPPRYGPDFAHFDYVDPNAPTGGAVRMADLGSFDSLNHVPPRGEIPLGIGLLYDTMTRASMDELSTEYGLLAEALRYPDDYSYVTYRLREEARWHDGVPVSPADVVFSFNALVEHNPQQAAYYSHVTSAEITGEREVTFTFDQTGNRELPHIVGQLIVMPAHWWTNEDGGENSRDISRGTLEAPLGSGPYRIADVSAGRSVTYERVEDYWAGDLNVNVGHYNFDEISYTYYRDSDVAFEAFKADEFDYRVENRARNWATGYDIPAVENGDLVLEEFEEPYRRRGLMVGFVLNSQRPLFGNRDIRRAFNYVLDFQELNRSIFFNAYTQFDSYFTGVDALASAGLPEGEELALLEQVRSDGHDVPEDVFSTAYFNPTNGSPEARRENIRTALDLFEQGGWSVREEVDPEQAGSGFIHSVLVTLGLRTDPTRRVMRDESGAPVVVELLLNGPTQEPAANQLALSLELVGIELVIRIADSSHFSNRVRSRDYDMIYSGWAQSTSPGNEQRDYFGSQSATIEGTRNYAGIENAAVDALIEEVIFAEDRQALEVATRALDRVLLWNHYVVPGWGVPAARVARWDRFGHPETLPTYSIGFPTIWWYDEARAARLEENGS